MKMKYRYFKSGINVIRLPEADLEKKSLSVDRVEVLIVGNEGNFVFESNELSRSIAETENIKCLESSDDPMLLLDKNVIEIMKMHKETGSKHHEEAKNPSFVSHDWSKDILAAYPALYKDLGKVVKIYPYLRGYSKIKKNSSSRKKTYTKMTKKIPIK